MQHKMYHKQTSRYGDVRKQLFHVSIEANKNKRISNWSDLEIIKLNILIPKNKKKNWFKIEIMVTKVIYTLDIPVTLTRRYTYNFHRVFDRKITIKIRFLDCINRYTILSKLLVVGLEISNSFERVWFWTKLLGQLVHTTKTGLSTTSSGLCRRFDYL